MSDPQKAKMKFEFENKEQYLIAKYKEQLDFALFQVQGQLDSAKQRKNEELKNIKIFGTLLILFIVVMLVCIIMSIGCGMMGGGARIVGLFFVGLLFLDIPCLIYGLPICLYHVMRGYILLQINKQSQFGKWIAKKWKISVVTSEIRECEAYVRRYQLILEHIEECRQELELTGETDIEALKQRVEFVDKKPVIPVSNMMYGRVSQRIRPISVITAIILYILMILCAVRFYGAFMKEIAYLWDQVGHSEQDFNVLEHLFGR